MFVGRVEELKLLQNQLGYPEARLVVLYGRRRVGKTALVDNAFENARVWKFEGIEGQTTLHQIRHFLFTLKSYIPQETELETAKIKTWQEAFSLLEKHLPLNKPLVIFFDEFQWLAGMRKEMVAVFKWAWDNFFSKHPRCCFVICGSVSSFIVRNIVKSTALYGRINFEIHLKPFTLPETAKLLGPRRTNREALETYMVLGGIPYYLKELCPDQSLVQNIQRLAFTPHGFFFGEYQRLFISHFAKSVRYEQIMRSLSRTHQQTQEQCAGSIKQSAGGTFSKLLEDLVLAGFIEGYIPIDKDPGSKLIKYRIQDEFLHFYYQFIEKNRKAIEEGTLHSFELLTGPRYSQWRGYAFERLCQKHASLIAHALGFSGIRYEHGSWFRTSTDNAAQIDLLFKRADTILTICEVKWAMSTNVAAVVKEMDAKIAVLKKFIDWPIQKVLIVAEKGKTSSAISAGFDRVLFAEEIFF
jgi:AAA+ ATPase superfamily predicted ATPase